MAALLDGGIDLSGLAGCYVAIALIAIIGYLIEQIISAFDFSLFGYNPLHGPLESLKGLINTGIGDAINGLESAAAGFESGLLQSLELFIGLTLLLGDAVYLALKYLWKTGLHAFITAITNPIVKSVEAVGARVTSLTQTVADDLGKAERYADSQVTSATRTIESTLRNEIATAKSTAESYADTAVAKLRAAEDTALSSAVKTLNAGIAAAETAAHTAETEAEAFATSQVAKAEALANTAIADVRGIAVGAEDDISSLVGKLGIAGAAGLLASIPALATLVNVIASESGLDGQACRTKVKGICGTDPLAWAGLLAGIAALGVAFDLGELLDAALFILNETEGLIAKVGELAESEVETVGDAIGRAALAIAA